MIVIATGADLVQLRHVTHVSITYRQLTETNVTF